MGEKATRWRMLVAGQEQFDRQLTEAVDEGWVPSPASFRVYTEEVKDRFGAPLFGRVCSVLLTRDKGG